MIKLILLSVLLTGIISGCAGSPVRMGGQSVNEIITDAGFDALSNTGLCQKKREYVGRLLKSATNPYQLDTAKEGFRRGIRAIDLELQRRGYDKRYCEGGSYASRKNIYASWAAKKLSPSQYRTKPSNASAGGDRP